MKTRLRLMMFVLSLFVLLAVACDSVTVPPPEDATAERKTVSGQEIAVEGQISLDRNYYLVSDGSDSMNARDCKGDKESNIAASKWATKEFATKSVPTDVGLGLYVFDASGASERVPIGKNNREAILRAIDEIRANGGTPLNSSIAKGVDALRVQREKQLGYGSFVLIVVTDGQADTESGVAYAERYQIPIVTIGFCLNNTHPLAVHSLSYRDANSPEQLLGAFQEVLAESDSFSTD